MKVKNIMKRSWELLWSYKALWIFGIFLALTTAAGYSPQTSWQGSSSEYETDAHSYQLQPGESVVELFERAFDDLGDEIEHDFERDFEGHFGWNFSSFRQVLVNTLITIFIIAIVLFIAGRFLHYISETAIIRMVNDVEETEKKYTIREGFGLGWSSTSWKMFLIDMVFFLPLLALSIAFVLLVFWPMFTNVILNGETSQNILSMVTSIGLFFLFILVAIVITALLNFVKRFMRRKLVLDDVSVFEAIKQGNAFAWQNFKDVILVWLINFGINLVWPIVMIPVFLLVVAFVGIVGGPIGLIVYGASGGSIPAMIILGILVLLLMVVPPLAFVGGLKETYLSTMWTLTYRELDQLDVEVLDTAALEDGAVAS